MRTFVLCTLYVIFFYLLNDVKWSHTCRSCLIRDFRWNDFDETRDLLMTDLWRGRSLRCIWLRWRDTGEWDTWWGDNAAVSMQRVLLLNVNTKEPHWSLLSVKRCPKNEGTDSRHSRTERARAPLPFLPSSYSSNNVGVVMHEEADSGMPQVPIQAVQSGSFQPVLHVPPK